MKAVLTGYVGRTLTNPNDILDWYFDESTCLSGHKLVRKELGGCEDWHDDDWPPRSVKVTIEME